eukprot:6791712-Alexandrium_andersonii.AAC.1
MCIRDSPWSALGAVSEAGVRRQCGPSVAEGCSRQRSEASGERGGRAAERPPLLPKGWARTAGLCGVSGGGSSSASGAP